MKKAVIYLLYVLTGISVSLVSNAQKDTMLASGIMKRLSSQIHSTTIAVCNVPMEKLSQNRMNCLEPCNPDAEKNYIWCTSKLLKFRGRIPYVLYVQRFAVHIPKKLKIH